MKSFLKWQFIPNKSYQKIQSRSDERFVDHQASLIILFISCMGLHWGTSLYVNKIVFVWCLYVCVWVE